MDGLGLDTLSGYMAHDILIGGSTSYDNSASYLLIIQSEWSSAKTLAERESNLDSGIDDPASGTVYLRAGETVIDDQASDQLVWHPDFNFILSFPLDILSNSQCSACSRRYTLDLLSKRASALLACEYGQHLAKS